MTRKANILFVDDEKRVLNSMRALFRRDYELFLTTEGAAAVRIVSENPIDVVVADQRMPGMNGTEVLGKIKQLSPRTVRILLTGYADPAAVEGSINIGEVFRFLSKPCPPKMLREALDMAIATARANRAPPMNVQRSQPTVPPAVSRQHAAVARSQPAQPPAAKVTQFAPRAGSSAANSSHWQSVTEVVLSGDTSQEIRQLDYAPGQTGRTNILGTVGVVFFTIDPNLAEMAVRTISRDRQTVLVTTLARVVAAIEEKNIGVLVIDFSGSSVVLQKVIAALKSRLPELVIIIVSSARDTTDMISFINHGRVYRYLLKPLQAEALRIAINAAAAHHLYLRNNPELAKRQEAVSKPVAGDNSETLNQIFQRVQNLPRRDCEPTGS